MKKLLFSALFLMAFAAFGTVQAQDAKNDKLAKWEKPADTGIKEVDAYVQACADIYAETKDIRAQYDSIQNVQLDATTAIGAATGEDATLDASKKEYEALLDRVVKQQDAAKEIPAKLQAAVKKTPIGLKALDVKKSISSSKDALQYALEENASLLKAIKEQITTLSTSTVKAEAAE